MGVLLPTRLQFFYTGESLNNALDSFYQCRYDPSQPAQDPSGSEAFRNCVMQNVKMSLNYLTNTHVVSVVDVIIENFLFRWAIIHEPEEWNLHVLDRVHGHSESRENLTNHNHN